MLKSRHKLIATAALVALLTSPLASADNQAIAIDEMEAYLDFVEYGGGVIFAEQIPREEWPNFFVIDARSADQFEREHIPGAVNIEWRRVLAHRDEIPADQPVVIYCNTGSLSAQAGFALRVAGHENVLILQGGFDSWKASGGFDAASQSAAPVGH
jgi:rhodanese-related sulfurtransferase